MRIYPSLQICRYASGKSPNHLRKFLSSVVSQEPVPRIVVTTAGGDPVRNLRASDAEVMGRIAELFETQPDLPLYSEWEALPREQHASLLIQAAQVREATTRTAQAALP